MNLVQAYSVLPEDIKKKIEGIRGVFRHHVDYMNEEKQVTHPIVRKHPQTDSKALFLSRGQTVGLVGLPPDEEKQIFEHLLQHMEQQKFRYTHQWSMGDFLVTTFFYISHFSGYKNRSTQIWDNRVTNHRRESFSGTELRLMKRIQMLGEGPQK